MTTKKYLLKAEEIQDMEGVRKTHFLNPNAIRINKSLGDAVGLSHLGVHIIEVEPGRDTTEYHIHHYEEECIYILKGKGRLRLGDDYYDVEQGDFIGLPRNEIAHSLINDGTEKLVCLVAGQRLEFDVADYPDKAKRIFRHNNDWDLVDFANLVDPRKQIAAAVTPKQLVEQAIRPALKTLGMYSEAAEQLLLATAIQESGLKHRRQLNDGPARGLFQMEPATHDDIWNNYLKYRSNIVDALVTLLTSPEADKIQELETNDKYAAAMARIHYYRVPHPLPQKDDIEGMARYWKRYYNTAGGHGDEQQFVANWEHVMERAVV